MACPDPAALPYTQIRRTKLALVLAWVLDLSIALAMACPVRIWTALAVASPASGQLDSITAVNNPLHQLLLAAASTVGDSSSWQQ